MDSGPYEVVLPNVVVISIGRPITFTFDSLKDISFGISQKQHFEFVYSGLIKKFSNRESSSISIIYQVAKQQISGHWVNSKITHPDLFGEVSQ